MQPPRILKVALLPDAIKSGNHTVLSIGSILYTVGLKISEYLCQGLGSDVLEIVLPSDGQFGVRLGNGSWTGVVGTVQRGEADLGVAELSITQSRMEVVDFSYPYFVDEVSFVAQKPTLSFSWETVSKIFSSAVWCSLAASHVLVLLLFYALFRGRHSLSKIAVYAFGTVLGQQAFKRLEKTSEHLPVLFWMVAMMVVGTAYKAQLLSVLTLPTLTGVRNIRELSDEIEKGRYACATFAGSSKVHMLLHSQDRSFRVIGANLLKTGGTSDIETFLGKKGTVKTAFIANKQTLLYLKNKYFLSDDVFFSLLIAVVIRKDFYCREKINEVIHALNAAGLYGKYFKEEIFKKTMSNITHFFPHEREKVTSLSLLHLYSVFALLLVGYDLAFFSLMAELIVYEYHVFKKMK